MKKFLLALCMALLCVFTVSAMAEAVLPAVEVTIPGAEGEVAVEVTGAVMQPALTAEGMLSDSVTVTLAKNAEGNWAVVAVSHDGAAREAVAAVEGAEVPADIAALVEAAGVCEGTEKVVTLEQAGMTVAAYTGEDGTAYADVTVYGTAVAENYGRNYDLGDLKATTLTFNEDGSVKVTFDILPPVWIYYVDDVEGEVIFPSYKLSARIGDPTPAFPEGTPVREGYLFAGWGPIDPFVKGTTIYEARWLKWCTVSYVNPLDGSTLAEFVVLEGEATPTIDDPTFEGYEFNGWAPAVAGVVTDHATYEAQWLKWCTVTYFDWYDQKVLEQFTVLEGQPTPTIDPNRYTKASYVNMGFTTAIAPIVTEDVTYTMMQMVPPRENNVSGLKFVCSCSNNSKHNKTYSYSATLANYLRLDDISENVYFDGSNYKCVVYLSSDYTKFTEYYNNAISKKIKNSHSFVSTDTTSFTVTYDLGAKRWYADQSEINVSYVCATAPVATANTLKNVKINVKGYIDGTLKSLFGMYVEDGSYNIGSVTGNATDGWTVNISVTNFDAHIAKWEAKYGVKAVVDTAETGNIVYTFTYAMPRDGLIATDGSGWTFQAPSNTVKLNGYTIWVTVAE